MGHVGEAEVRRLMVLARLALPEEEIPEVAGHLDRLLGYIEQLRQMNVEGAPETLHVGSAQALLRTDQVVAGLPRERIMAAAPSAPAGLFEVPRVLDAGSGGLTSGPRDGEAP